MVYVLSYYHTMQCADTVSRQKNIHHTKPEVDHAWPACGPLFSAAWAIFGPPGIFK